MIKAELCYRIERIVGTAKYGKRLWSLTNFELEDILKKELEEKEKERK